MSKNYAISTLIWFIGVSVATAQITPFTANWRFEGNSDGSSSSGFVAASTVTYHGVNLLGVNPYTTGYAGQGANVQHWSTSGCDNNEYVEFSVQPTGSATITVLSLSFAFARSAQGPQQLMVRSNVDGFSSDLYSQGTSTNYQTASIALNSAGFSNQSGSITFRIYACNAMDTGGTLKLDEISINANALPVTLLSFTAKPEGDRVQLAWATSMEHDANRFVVERSRELNEYITVGEVAAKGTTDERQYYGLTDLNPQPGTNYYRLKQIDFDGTVCSYNAISVISRASEPVVSVYPNPANPDRIHLRLWNADNATVRLLTTSGQVVSGRLERQSGETNLVFEMPLPPGTYWLEVWTNGQKYTTNVLVM